MTLIDFPRIIVNPAVPDNEIWFVRRNNKQEQHMSGYLASFAVMVNVGRVIDPPGTYPKPESYVKV